MPDLSAYRFTATHEWVHSDGDITRVGISDHAQSQLGDVIFLELPEVGRTLAAGEQFGVIESVKAASDLYSPVAGRVAAVNAVLADAPEVVNSDPYGAGWMLQLDAVDDSAAELMDAATYAGSGGD